MEQRSDDDSAVADEPDGEYANIDALIAAINERHEALHVPRRVRIRRAITVGRVVIGVVLVAVGVVAWIWAPILAGAYTVAVLLCVAYAALVRPDPEIAVHGLGQSRNRVPNVEESRAQPSPPRLL